jgi:hypothetical protein
LSISEKNLADLAFIVLCSNIKEKLEHFEFLSVNQLLQKASAIENRSTLGEPQKSHRPNMHAIE